jgi:hypothetical protein
MTAKLILRREEVPINKKNGELQTHNGVCTFQREY